MKIVERQCKVNKILLDVKHIEKERDMKMDKKYNGIKLITSLDTYIYKDTLNKNVRSANSCFKYRLQTPIKYKLLKYNKEYHAVVKDLTFKFRENNNTLEELLVTFKEGVDKSIANDIGLIIRYIIIQDILPDDAFINFYIIKPIEVQNGDNMRRKKEKENKIKDMKSNYAKLTYEDFYVLFLYKSNIFQDHVRSIKATTSNRIDIVFTRQLPSSTTDTLIHFMS